MALIDAVQNFFEKFVGGSLKFTSNLFKNLFKLFQISS